MASGKKGKKTKGKTLALTDFLQETTGSIPIQPIRKTNINWADDVDDLDGYDNRKPVNVVLPTAPKASRDYEDISDKVPKEPPYCAYLSNLPYDVDEDEIVAFFQNMKIANMRIPKDDRGGEGSRSKGYGYVEFEDRDSLLEALVLRDTTLKNRRMRIEVAANSENDRRRGGRMDMGRDRGDRQESTGDWRSGPRTESSSDNDRRGGGGFGRDRDRDGGFSRGGDREERTFNREGMRDGAYNRDRDSRDSYRGAREARDEKPGGWRDGERVNRDQDRDRGYTRDRGNFRDSDRSNFRDSDRGGRFDRDDRGGRFDRDDRGGRFDRDDRDDRPGYGGGRRFDDRDRNEGFSRSNRDDRDKESEPANSEPRERPRLVLAPRTKPIESTPVAPVQEAAPAASIFGNAKPVDTSQREREIEEKLAKVQSTDKPIGRDSSREKRPNSRDGRASSRERRPSSRERRPSSKERNHHDEGDKKNVERSRPSRRIEDGPYKDKETPMKKHYEDKKGPRGENKSPEKTDKHKNEKPRREEKRERPEKEMPKLAEPAPPNFAANNKFAFLDTEDSD